MTMMTSEMIREFDSRMADRKTSDLQFFKELHEKVNEEELFRFFQKAYNKGFDAAKLEAVEFIGEVLNRDKQH